MRDKLKNVNWQIKKRARWVSHNTKWNYERALTVFEAILIEYMQCHEWSFYMWLDYYHTNDFEESLPFSKEEYENAFVPFKEGE